MNGKFQTSQKDRIRLKTWEGEKEIIEEVEEKEKKKRKNKKH